MEYRRKKSYTDLEKSMVFNNMNLSKEIEILQNDLDRANSKIKESIEIRLKAINYIKENCLTFTEWEEVEIGSSRYIQPKGKIKYKALSKNKVKELLEILEGEDKE